MQLLQLPYRLQQQQPQLADLMLANLYTSNFFMIVIVHDCYIKAGHGQFNVNILE